MKTTLERLKAIYKEAVELSKIEGIYALDTQKDLLKNIYRFYTQKKGIDKILHKLEFEPSYYNLEDITNKVDKMAGVLEGARLELVELDSVGMYIVDITSGTLELKAATEKDYFAKDMKLLYKIRYSILNDYLENAKELRLFQNGKVKAKGDFLELLELQNELESYIYKYGYKTHYKDLLHGLDL